jgi:hypothetical protein
MKNNTIEKFTGTFNKEDTGCTISVNSTIQSITDINVLGLYAYLLSKPNDWKIYPKEIQKHFKIGKNKTYALLNKLIALNLIKRVDIKHKGKYVEFIYMLYLKPYCTPSPVPCFQELENPELEKGDTYKTKKEQNKERSGGKTSPAHSEGAAVGEDHAPGQQPLNTTTSTARSTHHHTLTDFNLFLDRDIPCPSKPTIQSEKVLANAKAELAKRNLTLEVFLDYLTEKCGRWLYEPYNDKVNSFYVLLRLRNIEKACAGDFEDFN